MHNFIVQVGTNENAQCLDYGSYTNASLIDVFEIHTCYCQVSTPKEKSFLTVFCLT